jgi:hypothetical protein
VLVAHVGMQSVEMNEIYCEIGKSKNALLSVDKKLIHFKVQFDDENPIVYFSFENLSSDKYCDCHVGKIAYENQMKTMLLGEISGNPIIPQKYCGYCSKKYPPKQEHIIQLIDYEDIDVKAEDGKCDKKHK